VHEQLMRCGVVQPPLAGELDARAKPGLNRLETRVSMNGGATAGRLPSVMQPIAF